MRNIPTLRKINKLLTVLLASFKKWYNKYSDVVHRGHLAGVDSPRAVVQVASSCQGQLLGGDAISNNASKTNPHCVRK